jgi:ankyrin repeat protein
MSVQQLADAAAAGDASTVRRLLGEQPDLASAYTDEGWTALHLAATPEIAAVLLDVGADINGPNGHKFAGPGNSPLSAAAYQQRQDVARVLIERGAAVNQGDNSGFTPLHLAVAIGRIETARTLLQAGADPSARTGSLGGAKWARMTPLELLAVEDRAAEGGEVVPPEVDAEMSALLRRYPTS